MGYNVHRLFLVVIRWQPTVFSADYPFERAEEAGHWLDSEKLDEKVRADIAYNNAVRLLNL